ncbi:MAG: NAD-dependent glyceraldehyde-3-phosphate dehydrogenase, partial [uncultured Gemmatimonadaceae bacterium]
DDSRWHQRLRPHRSPGVARGPGAGSGGPRVRRHQRPHRHQDARPPVQVRLRARRVRGYGRGRRGADHRGRRRDPGVRREGPGQPPVGEAGRGHRPRVHRAVHGVGEGAGPHPGRRQEGHHLGAGEGRGHHDRDGRQLRQVRSGEAPHRLERVVHDELPRADGQGDPGQLRLQARVDGHDPQLHERPEHPRPPAQGPPARARRGALDDPDYDRRRQGHLARDPGAQGEDRRHRDPRPDARRLHHEPHGRGRAADDDRRGQRGLREGGRRRADGGRARLLHGAARVDRLRGQPELLRARLAQHERRGQDDGRHRRLVRQRVGLLVALRRPAPVHGRAAPARRARM